MTEITRRGAFSAKLFAVAAIGCSGIFIAGGLPRAQDGLEAVREASRGVHAGGSCRPAWVVRACASSPGVGCEAPPACAVPHRPLVRGR